MTQTYTRLRPWAKRTRTIVGGAIILAFSASQCLANDANHRAAKKPSTPFEDARIIIEFNSTDQDVGVQFFLDVDSWQTVQILDPRGKEIYQSTAKGRLLRQGGGTELFMESQEPTLDELPLDDGERLFSQAEFTHNIPAGPQIIMPAHGPNECAKNVPIPVVLAWNAVTTSIDAQPIDVTRYEVVIEHEDSTFDVILPATSSPTLTVSGEFLEPGTEYGFEVLAIEEGGNQTITADCFVTAK
jgi:hypothetical protein